MIRCLCSSLASGSPLRAFHDLNHGIDVRESFHVEFFVLLGLVKRFDLLLVDSIGSHDGRKLVLVVLRNWGKAGWGVLPRGGVWRRFLIQDILLGPVLEVLTLFVLFQKLFVICLVHLVIYNRVVDR